ncbi:hypothetical protein F4825DRAFT_438682 [Nemania diffusa]|nr:hypothetical protein F4825DRAFT_438682 [Nemania diffusa]
MQEMMDLKRHLWTAHRQPPYCPICYDTFVLSEDWEDHIRLGSCVPSGRTRPEGISGLQMQQLARRADPWISRETQWLVIWETVFPGVKPPPLGSLTGEVETAVWALRDFWSTDGGRIVSDFVTERQQHNPHLWHDESDVATIKSVVLGCLIDQLVKTYR